MQAREQVRVLQRGQVYFGVAAWHMEQRLERRVAMAGVELQLAFELRIGRDFVRKNSVDN
jgi:hypothetical protein